MIQSNWVKVYKGDEYSDSQYYPYYIRASIVKSSEDRWTKKPLSCKLKQKLDNARTLLEYSKLKQPEVKYEYYKNESGSLLKEVTTIVRYIKLDDQQKDYESSDCYCKNHQHNDWSYHYHW